MKRLKATWYRMCSAVYIFGCLFNIFLELLMSNVLILYFANSEYMSLFLFVLDLVVIQFRLNTIFCDSCETLKKREMNTPFTQRSIWTTKVLQKCAVSDDRLTDPISKKKKLENQEI